MIPYNTDLEKLILPEYGRLIQEMVKICKSLENRDERNQFSAMIVETMKLMNAEKGKLADDRKFWDHLFIIGGPDLDIDSPYGRPDAEAANPTPAKIPYSNSDFGRRHYGHILQQMIHQVALMPNSEDKDACVELIANHIKKSLVIHSNENATDSKVYEDLKSMSQGSISVEEGIFDLPEFKEDKPTKTQKRKKNR